MSCKCRFNVLSLDQPRKYGNKIQFGIGAAFQAAETPPIPPQPPGQILGIETLLRKYIKRCAQISVCK